MKTARRVSLLFLVLALLLGVTACGTPTGGTAATTAAATTAAAETTAAAAAETTAVQAASGDPMVVGFIYVGPIGDGGYTYAQDQGRLYMEKELGAKIKTIYRESVPEGPDVEKAMKDMIQQGAKAIFATSYGYMDYVEKVAKEFPDVKFFHCSGTKSNDSNFVNYFGRIEQPRYLSGMVAAMKSTSGKIGYVAAYEIPEVIRGINAFTLGAQSINPNITVEIRWTHTWYDPAKEKEAATALLDEGCDIIAQHQDTTGPQIAAEEKGMYAVGYNTDSSKAVPKAFLTAPVWNWGPYFTSQVSAILDGSWKATNYWGGMADGVVQLAPLTSLCPADAQAKVDEVSKKIIDGSFDVWAGPISDQDGNVKIAEGATVDDAGQLGMMWFVKGVVGKIEQ